MSPELEKYLEMMIAEYTFGLEEDAAAKAEAEARADFAKLVEKGYGHLEMDMLFSEDAKICYGRKRRDGKGSYPSLKALTAVLKDLEAVADVFALDNIFSGNMRWVYGETNKGVKNLPSYKDVLEVDPKYTINFVDAVSPAACKLYELSLVPFSDVIKKGELALVGDDNRVLRGDDLLVHLVRKHQKRLKAAAAIPNSDAKAEITGEQPSLGAAAAGAELQEHQHAR